MNYLDIQATGNEGHVQAVAGRPSCSKAAVSPARPGVDRLQARPCDGGRLCWSNRASCRLAGRREGQDQGPGRAQDVTVTASAYLPEEGRGGEGVRGKGEGEEERNEEERGANNLVSWMHVLYWAFRYMHGQQCASAGVQTELCQHEHRAKQARA
jgi:hypothetical protein